MAFENKTVESVYSLIVNGLEEEFNVTFRLLPKSFIRIMAKVMAGIYITLYKMIAWVFLQIFPSTATFDEITILGRKLRPLVEWGELVGIGSPAPATQWEGTISVNTSEVNTYLSQGTQFRNSATGKIYIATESKLLANMSEIIKVRCAEAGSSGNLSVDDELTAVNALSNIERKAVCVSVLTVGKDAESASSYRARVRNRWRGQPQGGSLTDYRQWAAEVGNVFQSYPYKDDESASGVLIYVAADTESRIPDNDLLIKVGEACSFDPETGAARKPIGAVLDPDNDGTFANVRPVEVTDFDVKIIGYSEAELNSFKSSCKSTISAYFIGREPFIRGLSYDDVRNDRISSVNISAIVDTIAEGLNGYFESVELWKGEEQITSYNLDRGELAKLNKLYINGVEV